MSKNDKKKRKNVYVITETKSTPPPEPFWFQRKMKHEAKLSPPPEPTRQKKSTEKSKNSEE